MKKNILLALLATVLPLSLMAAKPVDWSKAECRDHLAVSYDWINEAERRKKTEDISHALIFAQYHLALYNACLNT